MAVKAREDVRQREFSPLLSLGIMAAIILYMVFFKQILESLPNDSIRNIVNMASLIIMLVAFFLILRFISTSFTYLLTHAEYTVDRKILFWNKQVVNIPTKDFVAIVPEAEYKNDAGRPQNVAVGKITDMEKYVLTYKAGTETKAIKLQCGTKFYKQTAALIRNGGASNTNKSNKKKKKK